MLVFIWETVMSERDTHRGRRHPIIPRPRVSRAFHFGGPPFAAPLPLPPPCSLLNPFIFLHILMLQLSHNLHARLERSLHQWKAVKWQRFLSAAIGCVRKRLAIPAQALSTSFVIPQSSLSPRPNILSLSTSNLLRYAAAKHKFTLYRISSLSPSSGRLHERTTLSSAVCHLRVTQ